MVLQMLVPSASLQAIAEEVVGGGDPPVVLADSDLEGVDVPAEDEPVEPGDDAASDDMDEGEENGDEAPSPKPVAVARLAAAQIAAPMAAAAPVAAAAPQADGVSPRAADTVVNGLTISGGTNGTDYTVSGTTVIVNADTPLTLKGSFTGSIQIAQGKSANITLAGVNITANSISSPINLMGSGTTLKLFLADGTTNTLNSGTYYCSALHCGQGSTLYVDDSVANWSGSTHVEVLNGVVDTTATLDNGTAVSQGDPVTRLASANPGTLIAYGGYGSGAIGSGPSENSGNMYFDGGTITAYSAGGHANNHGTNANQSWSSGTGIGAGNHGGATNMWFNGARVAAYGSYHGAGIGAGWTTANGSAQTGAVGTTPNNTCGNIYINAGYLTSQGYEHGNAFGGACGTTANNCIIRITGGTLHPSSYSGKFDIGGTGGYTIVTGGSVYVSSKSKFTGVGGTAYNTQGVTTWSDVTALGGSLPDTDKVFMLTVDLSTSAEHLTNEKLEDFKLYIGGEDAHYGAPTEFEGGKLYLWLPEWVAAPNAEKEVRIEMSVRKDDGTVAKIDPLYIAKPSTSDTTQTVKRYIEFPFPDDYQKTLEKDYDGLPFPALVVDAAHPIEVVRQVGDQTLTELLNKADDVKFKYQMLKENEDGEWVPDGAESEEGAATLPTDTGRFQVTMTSYQYANDPAYTTSYWGHQAKGVATINPVPAVLTMEGVEWGHLADDGTWTQITQDSAAGQAGNRLKLTFNVRSANTTALTCAAPTGSFQVRIDGKEVGGPIVLTAEGVGASAFSTIEWPDISVGSQTGGTETRHATRVTYYLDPANRDGLLDILESAAGGGEHTVNIEYIADKNYIQGVDKNPDNAKEDDTFIVPVPPTGDVVPDPDDPIKVEPTPDPGPDDPDDPVDPDDKTLVVRKTITASYSSFHSNDAEIADFFNLKFQSSSSAKVTCTTSNAAVADIVRAEDGSIDLENIKVQVNSCGTATIVMEQGANALYTGTRYILTVNITPDPSIKPKVQIRMVTRNLDHPGQPARPGDRIEYLVTGLNLTEGSAWQAATLLDTLDSRLTLDEDSVRMAANYATPDVSTTLGTSAFYAAAAEQGFAWEDLDWGDLADDAWSLSGATVSAGAGTVYGGQSTTLRFVATLNGGTADRPTDPDDPKPVDPTPGGGGSWGVNPDPLPGEDPGTPKPLDPDNPDDIVIVGDDPTPDPDDPDNPNPVDPGTIPPLPVIPKDPVIVPGPDDPDREPDISVTKEAANLTHPDAKRALVGDEVSYTITLANKGADTAWYSPVIRDTLPQGLEFVPGTLVLTRVDGTEQPVDDAVYVESTRTIAVYVDDLYGGESTRLTFTCRVTPDAQGTEGANVAFAFGTTPTEKWEEEHPTPDPDDPDNPDDPDDPDDPDGPDNPDNPDNPDDPSPAPKPKPEPGDPFVPDPPAGVDPDDSTYDPWEDFDWDTYPENKPTPNPSDPVTPGQSGGVMPADPDEDGLAMALTGENLTRDISRTMVGDTIRYTATFTNTQDHTALYDTVLRNIVPDGLTVVPGSIYVEVPDTAAPVSLLALTDGVAPAAASEVTEDGHLRYAVADGAYVDATRTIGVRSGHMPAGTSVRLVYDAVVGPEAAGRTILDRAWGHGMKPSHYDLDSADPRVSEAFVPSGTLAAFLATEGLATLPATHEIPVSDVTDPADGAVTLTKTAKNLTSTDGNTYVGDRVRYTLTLANDTPGSAVYDAVIEDTVPAGLAVDESTVRLVTANGRSVACRGVYDAATRRLSVVAGDVFGRGRAVLTFEVGVTAEAVGADVGNVARAFATLPSDMGDGERVPLVPGTRFDPPAGWDAFLTDSGSLSVNSGDAVYPSERVSAREGVKGRVLPVTGGRGLVPVTGDAASLAPALGLMAAVSAAATAWVRRRR
ncbi:isopeptide-forming domain-containing fimbrial protein [Atopobiaceae bacterium 24-176]